MGVGPIRNRIQDKTQNVQFLSLLNLAPETVSWETTEQSPGRYFIACERESVCVGIYIQVNEHIDTEIPDAVYLYINDSK